MDALERRLLGLYSGSSWLDAAYLRLRLPLLDLPALLKAAEGAKRVLDLGCGYGLAANALCLADPDRRVEGLDLSERRVARASRAAQGHGRASFRAGDMAGPFQGPYDAVLLIDVLHYLAPPSQESLLAACRQALRPGGLLILREADASQGLRMAWTLLHERLAAAAGLTKARPPAGGLHFRTLREHREALARADFEEVSVSARRGWLPYADTLFIFRSRAE